MRSVHRTVLLRRLRHQVLGIAFLLVVVLFFVATIAAYGKVFTPAAQVRLETDHVGSQLRRGADVKIRGMVVGEVRSVETLGDHAALELALRPDTLDAIPAGVSARLLPKTLFGERYVALQPPPHDGGPRLRAGDVITQDRSSTAIELERVLADVMPLLQSVQPQKLSSTLGAISTALEGRGTQVGRTLVQLSRYLGELSPSLPDLEADITGLADVSHTYSQAAPDLLAALSDLTTTTRTLVDERHGLTDLFATVGTASTDLASFLRVNKNNIIGLTTAVQPTLDLLAEYAPEYPCLLQQLAAQVPNAELAFGKGTAHPEVSRVTIEFTPSRGKYLPGVDEPRWQDKRGPRCYPTVPHPGRWPQYPPDGAIKDGSTTPPAPRDPPGSLPGYGGGGTPAGASSLPNSPAERELVAALRARALGVAPAEVPNWSSLLVGPLYRGTEVELR
jgi:virulence factor Mce-like protein